MENEMPKLGDHRKRGRGKIRYCKLQTDNTISNGKNQNKFTFYKIKKEMKKS
jgi:hypothetical protein